MKMAIALFLFLGALVGGEQSMSVWDGIYIPDQATRGKVIYVEQCAVCHGDELAGKNGPALTGATFKENWNGLTADDLFEYIKTSMPRGQTGRLTRDQTANIVAFLLTSNGFPAGKKELPTDAKALQGIGFDAAKPGAESAKPK
jgi:S-disulfanyl-L-cysteine oxidoreductase SoxD